MSDETITTTPAERLLEILQAGRSVGRKKDAQAGQVWAAILGVKHDSPEYIRLVVEINKMIADLIQLVADSPFREPAKHNYGRTLRHILAAFQGNTLSANWEHTRGTYLTDQQIDDLENLDSQLAHWQPSGKLSNEQIVELKEDIDRVREQLDSSELPPELTKLLRSHVEAIRRVLAHYSIYGNEGLHDELKRIIGDLGLHHEIFKQHRNSPAVRAFKGLVAKALTVADLVSLPASAITIGGAVGWLLGG